MGRTLSEKKVLRKLGIKDFRHMTKEKVVKFASMLPYMDPEVAKAALEQFPAFKDLAGEIVETQKEIVNRAISSNDDSVKMFYDSCNSILDSLKEELKDPNIDSDERSRIEDKMIGVARMIAEKDSENKSFLIKAAAIALTAGVAVLATAAAVLGANSDFSSSEDDEDDDE